MIILVLKMEFSCRDISLLLEWLVGSTFGIPLDKPELWGQFR